MITRTFRISHEYDEILNAEAEKHGLSVSALLNQIIRQYVIMTRYDDRNPNITLSNETFKPILNSVSELQLIEIAQKNGSMLPEEAILKRGEKLDFETIIWFIEMVQGRYNNWFVVNRNRVNNTERIHLGHKLNHSWSVYLTAYIQSMFKSILDIEPKIETRDSSITFYSPKTLNSIKHSKSEKHNLSFLFSKEK